MADIVELKKIRIILDARVVTEKMHGIARYTVSLLQALLELDTKNQYIILHNHNTPEVQFNKENRSNVELVRCELKPYSLAEQLFLPGVLKKHSPDVYHSPSFSAPLFPVCPTLMTIHDVIHLTQATTFSMFHRIYYGLIVKGAAHKAFKIFTVSEHSKKEIARNIQLPLEKIVVTYNGIDHSTFKPKKNDSSSCPEEGCEVGYWLFVGNPKPHKNLVGLITAYNTVRKTLSALPPLVVVGVSRDFLDRTFDVSQIQGIITMHPKTDEELATMYKNASLFIAPSHEEGFGLPVLEALCCGVPVVASKIGSIQEIAGEAACYFDSNDSNSMTNAILTVTKDPQLQKGMIEMGQERAKLFVWKKTAQQTLKQYRESVTR